MDHSGLIQQVSLGLERRTQYAAAAALCENARVLVIGDVDDRDLSTLREAGARSVTATRPHRPNTLSFGEHTFDLVIALDLADRWQREPRLADEIRRVLDPEGYLVTAGPNHDNATVSVDDLEARLSGSYGSVTTFAQTPIVGSMFFDFDAEELEFDLDRRLVREDTDPSHFLLILGPTPPASETLTVTELPFDEVLRALTQGFRQVAARERTERPAPPPPTRSLSDRSRLNEALASALTEAEAALEESQEKIHAGALEIQRLRVQAERASEQELVAREKWVVLQQQLLEARGVVDGQQQEIERAVASEHQARENLERAETFHSTLQGRIESLETEQEALRRRCFSLEESLDEAQSARHHAAEQASQLGIDCDRLGSELQVARQAVLQREDELRAVRAEADERISLAHRDADQRVQDALAHAGERIRGYESESDERVATYRRELEEERIRLQQERDDTRADLERREQQVVAAADERVRALGQTLASLRNEGARALAEAEADAAAAKAEADRRFELLRGELTGELRAATERLLLAEERLEATQKQASEQIAAAEKKAQAALDSARRSTEEELRSAEQRSALALRRVKQQSEQRLRAAEQQSEAKLRAVEQDREAKLRAAEQESEARLRAAQAQSEEQLNALRHDTDARIRETLRRSTEELERVRGELEAAAAERVALAEQEAREAASRAELEADERVAHLQRVLGNQVQELEREVDRIAESKTESSATHQLMHAEIDRLKAREAARAEGYVIERDELREAIRRAEAESLSVKGKCEQLTAALAEHTERIRELEGELTARGHRIDALEEDIAEREARIARLAEAMDVLSQRETEFRSRIDALESELEAERRDGIANQAGSAMRERELNLLRGELEDERQATALAQDRYETEQRRAAELEEQIALLEEQGSTNNVQFASPMDVMEGESQVSGLLRLRTEGAGVFPTPTNLRGPMEEPILEPSDGANHLSGASTSTREALRGFAGAIDRSQ
ncbi:MAG: methyltransferase domain-containing protein [Myxococcota bacterium]